MAEREAGSPIPPDLKRQLAKARSKLDRMRLSAARNLGRFDHPRAREALAARLVIDPCLKVQVAALEALAAVPGNDALAAIVRAYRGDTFFAVRGDGSPGEFDTIVRAAALALAKRGTPEAVAVLLETLAATEGAGGGGSGWTFAGKGDLVLGTTLMKALEACPRSVLLETARRHPGDFVRRFVNHYWGEQPPDPA